MRIAMVQYLSYLFLAGGAHKANRYLMEMFAKDGHECTVICPGYEQNITTRNQILAEIEKVGGVILSISENEVVYRLNGVQVHAITGAFQMVKMPVSLIRAGNFDCVLVTEDRTFFLLQTIVEENFKNVFYIGHSQATLPFGPESFKNAPDKAVLFEKLDGLIAVSNYVKNYVNTYSTLSAELLYFPSYGPGPFPNLANFDSGTVAMINPIDLKGATLFEDVVQAMPQVQFGAVQTWGDSESLVKRLSQRGNFVDIPSNPDMNLVLQHIKILLVPSLWGEAFGQVVVDAMLRGIPVIASDLGGLTEAKLGVPYLLPVNPIREYVNKPLAAPAPVIPEQNIEPWISAIQRLTTDRTHYNAISQQSYQASHQFINSLSSKPFIEYIERVEMQRNMNEKKNSGQLSELSSNQLKHEHLARKMSQLSIEQRALLRTRLENRTLEKK